MVCKLQKHGNAHALVIDRATMQSLGIDEHTPLEIEIDDGRMMVRPCSVGIGRDRIQASIDKLRPRYERMLQHLAQ